MKHGAVVLVSGGMDSLVSAAIAASEGYDMYLLHVNYGQRTEKRELKAFREIASYYNAKKSMIADMKYLSDIGGSSLTDHSIPVASYNPDLSAIPSSYVPFRNANILSLAVSWAEVCNAKKIFIGAVEEDSSGYPDCREVFFNAFNQVIRFGTKPDSKIEVVTPLIHMKKSEIVRKGLELKVPFELSWSCYKSEDVACGECDSCFLRLRGFYEAGADDPIPYRKKTEFSNYSLT